MGTLLVEAGHGGLCKVDPVNLVRLLVIRGDHSSTCHALLNSIIAITVASLCCRLHVVHDLQNRISPDYLEADIDIKEAALLLHYQPRVEAWPHLNVVSVKAVRSRLVETFLTDLLKA